MRKVEVMTDMLFMWKKVSCAADYTPIRNESGKVLEYERKLPKGGTFRITPEQAQLNMSDGKTVRLLHKEGDYYEYVKNNEGICDLSKIRKFKRPQPELIVKMKEIYEGLPSAVKEFMPILKGKWVHL